MVYICHGFFFLRNNPIAIWLLHLPNEIKLRGWFSIISIEKKKEEEEKIPS